MIPRGWSCTLGASHRLTLLVFPSLKPGPGSCKVKSIMECQPSWLPKGCCPVGLLGQMEEPQTRLQRACGNLNKMIPALLGSKHSQQ